MRSSALLMPRTSTERAKTIQQLRTQVAFFGVHGADEDEARGVGEADAFALDDVYAHRGGIQQQVDDVVIEQIDFIDIEDAAVGVGEDAGVEMTLALLDGLFDIQRADDAVFGGGDGQNR